VKPPEMIRDEKIAAKLVADAKKPDTAKPPVLVKEENMEAL